MSQPDAILIHAPAPGYNRFKVARDIQNACNTSGVAREPIRVIEDAAHDPQCGCGRLTHDPAVVAVINKLSSMMVLDPFEAHDECARSAARPLQGGEEEGGRKGTEAGPRRARPIAHRAPGFPFVHSLTVIRRHP